MKYRHWKTRKSHSKAIQHRLQQLSTTSGAWCREIVLLVRFCQKENGIILIIVVVVVIIIIINELFDIFPDCSLFLTT